MGIILAAVIVGGTGLILGLFLGVSDKKLKVEIDEKEELVRAALPGNNCGGCGFPGCDGLAKAIAQDEAAVDACPVGGDDVSAKIAEIMGKEAGAQARQVAFVQCSGTCEKTHERYQYHGARDCEMVNFVPSGGPNSCSYGCLGFGTCVRVCPFDAIHVTDGIAVVDQAKCKACGKCIARCPRKLIEMVPEQMEYRVRCISKDKGKDTMQACKAGCIGCKKCEKECPAEAVKVVDNIAHIDYEKCEKCGLCAQVCPKKVITNSPA